MPQTSYSIQVTTAEGIRIGESISAPDKLDAALAKTRKALRTELCIHQSLIDKSKVPDAAILYQDGIEISRWTNQQQVAEDDSALGDAP